MDLDPFMTENDCTHTDVWIEGAEGWQWCNDRCTCRINCTTFKLILATVCAASGTDVLIDWYTNSC